MMILFKAALILIVGLMSMGVTGFSLVTLGLTIKRFRIYARGGRRKQDAEEGIVYAVMAAVSLALALLFISGLLLIIRM